MNISAKTITYTPHYKGLKCENSRKQEYLFKDPCDNIAKYTIRGRLRCDSCFDKWKKRKVTEGKRRNQEIEFHLIDDVVRNKHCYPQCTEENKELGNCFCNNINQ